MPNIYESPDGASDGLPSVRLGEQAGGQRLGMSLYELRPGQAMVFHYHIQREELLVVLSGALALRTASGWRE